MLSIISDPYFYCAAIPAVIILGLAKGGFASVGNMATPLLALYLPPLEAAALLLPILISQDLISVYVYRRNWDASNLKIMLPGAVIGTGIAWLIASHISDNAVRLAVGTIGVSFVAYMWLRRAVVEARKMSTASGVFWGALSGFTTFMTQGGSPPFQVHVLPQRLPKMIYVGTTVMFFAAANVMKIVPYFALGQFSATGLATSFALFPLAIACNFLGIYLVRITPEAMFYRLTNGMVLLLGCELTRQGLVELFWR